MSSPIVGLEDEKLSIRSVNTTWYWDGDFTKLKGFNVAVTSPNGSPTGDTIAFKYVNKPATEPADKKYSTTIRNALFLAGKTYVVWIQALYQGGESTWVSSTGETVVINQYDIATIKVAEDIAIDASGTGLHVICNAFDINTGTFAKTADMGLWIDVDEDIHLGHVQLRADADNVTGTIVLKDRSNGTALYSKDVVLMTGVNTVNLNFLLKASIGEFWLGVEGGWTGGNVIKHTGGSFPYDFGTFHVIDGGSISTPDNSWNWFYNLEVGGSKVIGDLDGNLSLSGQQLYDVKNRTNDAYNDTTKYRDTTPPTAPTSFQSGTITQTETGQIRVPLTWVYGDDTQIDGFTVRYGFHDTDFVLDDSFPTIKVGSDARGYVLFLPEGKYLKFNLKAYKVTNAGIVYSSSAGELVLDRTGNTPIISGGEIGDNDLTGVIRTAISGQRVEVASDGIKTYDNLNNQRVWIKSDGSGWLGNATNGIAWDSAGQISVYRVTANQGSIGGWNIDSSKLFAGSGSSYIGLSPTVGIYLGADTFASAPFRVAPDGSLTASNANITGVINATSGNIGSWSISSGALSSTGIKLTPNDSILLGSNVNTYADASIGLKNDGSGKLANGNISWDSVGALTIKNGIIQDGSGNNLLDAVNGVIGSEVSVRSTGLRGGSFATQPNGWLVTNAQFYYLPYFAIEVSNIDEYPDASDFQAGDYVYITYLERVNGEFYHFRATVTSIDRDNSLIYCSNWEYATAQNPTAFSDATGLQILIAGKNAVGFKCQAVNATPQRLVIDSANNAMYSIGFNGELLFVLDNNFNTLNGDMVTNSLAFLDDGGNEKYKIYRADTSQYSFTLNQDFRTGDYGWMTINQRVYDILNDWINLETVQIEYEHADEIDWIERRWCADLYSFRNTSNWIELEFYDEKAQTKLGSFIVKDYPSKMFLLKATNNDYEFNIETPSLKHNGNQVWHAGNFSQTQQIGDGTATQISFTLGSDILHFKAGTNVTLNFDDTNNTLTINSAGTGDTSNLAKLDQSNTFLADQIINTKLTVGTGTPFANTFTIYAVATGLRHGILGQTSDSLKWGGVFYNTTSGIEADFAGGTYAGRFVGSVYISSGNLTVNSGNVTVNGYLTLYQPSTPLNLVLTENSGVVTVQFDESGTADVDEYEIWRSETSATSGFVLVGLVPKADVSPTMSVIDDTFTKNTTLYYRIYAVKNGVRSNALTGSITVSTPVPDVTNMQVLEFPNYFIIQYDIPDDPRVDHVEIKVDKQANQIDLNEGNATLVYSGNRDTFVYKIDALDMDKYHKFWVYVVTRS